MSAEAKQVFSNFSEKSPIFSKALQVEGRDLWVPPAALACVSEVFKRMFYGEFAEKEMEIVPLPEKYEEMLEFLRCLIANPIAKKVTDENLKVNLRLADEYQVNDLMDKCEKFLCEKFLMKGKWPQQIDTALEMVELACQYKLEVLLKEHLVPHLARLPLDQIQKAYNRPIKSSFLLAVMDLKLQQQPKLRRLCNVCYREGSCMNCEKITIAMLLLIVKRW